EGPEHEARSEPPQRELRPAAAATPAPGPDDGEGQQRRPGCQVDPDARQVVVTRVDVAAAALVEAREVLRVDLAPEPAAAHLGAARRRAGEGPGQRDRAGHEAQWRQR